MKKLPQQKPFKHQTELNRPVHEKLLTSQKKLFALLYINTDKDKYFMI